MTRAIYPKTMCLTPALCIKMDGLIQITSSSCLGNECGHSAPNVRFLLLTDIAADVEFYQQTSFVCLEMRNTSFNQWITNLSIEEMYADELTLFSLSWLYKQHMVVITKNKLWSTLHSNSPVNEEALLDICSVKLVYLGQLRFGTL